MKMSHGELEGCIKRPRAWLLQKRSESSHPFRVGYDRVLLLAIYRFHKTNSEVDATKYLMAAIKRQDFKDQIRVGAVEKKFEAYLKWIKASSVSVADSRVRMSFDCGFVRLMGEIARLDITESTYRAVLLTSQIPADWESQLRMPLIQLAISQQYGRPLKEVEVGIQKFDGSQLQSKSFSSRVVNDAKVTLEKLAKELEKIDSAI
jgi:hypothetical protein